MLVDTIVSMRESRDGLVETPEQYRYITNMINRMYSDTSKGLRDSGLPRPLPKHPPNEMFKRLTGYEVPTSMLLIVLCWLIGISFMWFSWCRSSVYKGSYRRNRHNTSGSSKKERERDKGTEREYDSSDRVDENDNNEDVWVSEDRSAYYRRYKKDT